MNGSPDSLHLAIGCRTLGRCRNGRPLGPTHDVRFEIQ